jgi:GT2 family glycosyltransferase
VAKIAVVILNYNGAHFLRQFLPSVMAHSPGAEIMVADNASTDSSLEVLAKEFPSVKVILLDKNYGFCGGYNRALAQVTSEYYVLLNSDVAVTEHWLRPLEELLDTHSAIAAVQPKIKAYNQPTQFEYAGAAGGFIDSLGYPFCRGRLFTEIETDNGQYNDTREVFWATGACMMVRATVYQALGGLDEDFFAHMEEIDLCWRIKQTGRSVYYCGSSTVYHVGGGTLAKQHPFKTLLNFRNGLFLLIKNLPALELVYKLPVRLLLDYVAAVRFLLIGQPQHTLAILQAHMQVIKRSRKMWLKRMGAAVVDTGIYPGLTIWDFFVRKRKSIYLS